MGLPKISVIVPVYKVEDYLKRCIDSIINQTYRNLEIILVDDGSPDKCGDICDEYAGKDNRIKVIHKSNGGLSDARNKGIEVATGEYIGFVDSDDWIESTMYERLLNLIKKYNADIAIGGVADVLVDNDAETIVKTSDFGCQDPFVVDKKEAMKRYFYGSWSAWDKLYDANLFDNIRFPVGEINEDEAIVLDILDQCKYICYTSEIFYHYMKHVGSNSITSSDFSIKKLAWENHCKKNLSFIRDKYPELEEAAATRYCNSILWSLTEIAMCDNSMEKETEMLLKNLKEEYSLFSRIYTKSNISGVRLRLIRYLPFRVYRKIIRLKRMI